LAFDNDKYERWLANCLQEFNERFGENRLYFAPPETYPDDYCPGQLVEFAEDGDAYPHGPGGTGHISKAVTPFKTWSEANT
jgi:hypothetical protein